jgi:hypothetical protein
MPGLNRRTRLHARRSLGAITLATAPAATTEQLYPRHDRLDRGQGDIMVAMPAALEALDTSVPQFCNPVARSYPASPQRSGLAFPNGPRLTR